MSLGVLPVPRATKQKKHRHTHSRPLFLGTFSTPSGDHTFQTNSTFGASVMLVGRRLDAGRGKGAFHTSSQVLRAFLFAAELAMLAQALRLVQCARFFSLSCIECATFCGAVFEFRSIETVTIIVVE